MAENVYRINEIFASIQGEGIFIGTPAIFIRFQGCPIHCRWCDTKNSWDIAKAQFMTSDDIMKKIEIIKTYYPLIQHVVITGGEPFFENPGLYALLERLHYEDFEIQIETSGTQETEWEKHQPVTGWIYLTISPKAPNDEDEYLPVDEQLLRRSDEIKFVVASEKDLQTRIPRFLEQHQAKLQLTQIVLQPCHAENEEDTKRNIAMCVEYAKKHDYRVGGRLHKTYDLK